MANRNNTNPLNAPGTFYVDLTCIDCDICRNIAPSIFTRDDDEALTYVKQQPVTDEQIAQAREAMQGCPMECIGDDG
jgi:ferredoxin